MLKWHSNLLRSRALVRTANVNATENNFYELDYTQSCYVGLAAGKESPQCNLVVEPGDIVTVHYKCYIPGGEVLESSDGKPPITFQVGVGEVMGNPLFGAFDQSIRGLVEGQKVTIESIPDKWKEDMVFDVPRDHEEIARLEEVSIKETGAGLATGSLVVLANGEPAVVVGMTEDTVRIDANHPLADATVLFDIEVVSIERS
eukprot:jgi/Mesvir1/8821/Mv02722-RA.1